MANRSNFLPALQATILLLSLTFASAQSTGSWGPVVDWAGGVIPVSLVNLPGGNHVLGFAAANEDTFRVSRSQNDAMTRAQVYDLNTGEFDERDLLGHDMFCAGLTLLPDGKLLAVGGGSGDNSFRVSMFDPKDRSWQRLTDTVLGHWYGTLVMTRKDRALIALGVDNNDPSNWEIEYDFPELSRANLDFSRSWKNMSNVDFSGRGPDRNHWYPVLHLMPNGEILESGTQNSMFAISTTGRGAIRYVGERNKVTEEQESWGAATIMYEAGKLITIGGIENWMGDNAPDRSVYQRAITIDMNDPQNIKSELTGGMAFRRAFPSLVVLPSGEVLAIGGKDNTVQFDDRNSVFTPEIWNPESGEWTQLAEHQIPRNYHSTAILLQDGRVMSAGGGLCDPCPSAASNQPNSQIFTPPYLLTSTGELRPRPVIDSAPLVVRRNDILDVVVSGFNADQITRISIVKLSSVTHSITTDARQLRLEVLSSGTAVSASSYNYAVRASANLNVMTPGFWFLFVLDSDGTPSVAKEIQVVR